MKTQRPSNKYKSPYPRDAGNNDFREFKKRYVNSPPNLKARANTNRAPEQGHQEEKKI
jgi:hypothetical protein